MNLINNLYKLGITISVKIVAVNIPPTTTVAKGFCTSAPNPVENISIIEFSVPESQKVNVTVLNIQGQIVETLYNADVEANENYKLEYDVTDLQSGIYFIHLNTSNDVIKKKFIILK